MIKKSYSSYFVWFVDTKLKFLNKVIIHHLAWKNLTSQEMRTVEILRRDKQVRATVFLKSEK